MTTHFTTAAQQYNSRTVENTVDVSIGAGRQVLFVADTSVIQQSGNCSFTFEFLNASGGVLLGLATRVSTLGQASIGSTIPPGTTRGHLFLDVTGRMTMAFRIVSFAPGEDVPVSF